MRVLVVCRLLDAALVLRLRPLCTVPGVEEVLVVRHRPGPSLPGVRYLCPPRWLAPRLLQVVAEALLACGAALRYRPAVVHGIYLLPHGLIAVLAAKLSARPSVVAIIGTDLHGHLERGSAAWRRLLLAGLRRADRVTATGSRSLRRLAALGVAEGRLCILPNGVEVPPQAAVEPDLDLLFVGRLAEVKRPLHFVELVDRLRRRRGAVRAALLGDGPLRPAVEARLRELGLAGAVDLPGHVADVGRWLARSRLLVLPSRAEGLPYAVVEAMAAGVPPLAAAVGDLPDLVESGCSGLLVEDFDDLETVAAAVAALLDDEPARRRMGAAARQVARERFSLSACRLVWRDLLEDLAGASAA